MKRTRLHDCHLSSSLVLMRDSSWQHAGYSTTRMSKMSIRTCSTNTHRISHTHYHNRVIHNCALAGSHYDLQHNIHRALKASKFRIHHYDASVLSFILPQKRCGLSACSISSAWYLHHSQLYARQLVLHRAKQMPAPSLAWMQIGMCSRVHSFTLSS